VEADLPCPLYCCCDGANSPKYCDSAEALTRPRSTIVPVAIINGRIQEEKTAQHIGAVNQVNNKHKKMVSKSGVSVIFVAERPDYNARFINKQRRGFLRQEDVKPQKHTAKQHRLYELYKKYSVQCVHRVGIPD
jgi:hypothetical protein